MNRRGFAGVALAGIGGFLFPRKVKAITSSKSKIKFFTFDLTAFDSAVRPEGRRFPNKQRQLAEEAELLYSQGYEVLRIVFNEHDYAQYLNWMPREVWKKQSFRPIRIEEDKNLQEFQLIIEHTV